MRGGTRLVLALATACTLAACAGDPEPRAERSPTPTTSGSPNAVESDSPDPSPTASASGRPDAPAVVDPGTDLLDWQPTPGPVDTTTTVSGPWTLSVPEGGTSASLAGPRPARVEAPARHRITDALLDGRYAVVVAEDELAQRPNTATVIDLEAGERFVVDGDSSVPTTTGGTWALGEGRLLHATVGDDGAYCLAEVDLDTRESSLSWCAPRRHGFNDARVGPAGASLLTFDDARPSCRTVVEVEGSETTPFEGVPECTGWDGALLDGGAVWSVAAQANRIEQANFFARAGDGWYDLGPGTSGSLTPCGEAAYFVRDPQRDGEPARLMRWDPDGRLTVAYESAGRGEAFLTAPRCGGDAITLTALAQSGDVQVTAQVR